MTLADREVRGLPIFRKIPAAKGENVDFMVLVSVEDHEMCGDMNGGKIATAFACRWDECDRPVMGAVNICPRAVDPSSEKSVQSLFSTLAHEMTHVFGFNAENYQYMRHVLGSPRIAPEHKKVVYYTCSVSDGSVSVKWDVSPNRKGPLYKYIFPEGIIEGGVRRGVGEGCRCPLDPNKKYTSKDIAHCLTHREECIFILKTPRVAAMSKWYFDCPTARGAELENQRSEISCTILDSHWKQRLFGEEYMTSVAASLHGEISPVTFAFLEDTGWYRMNYAMTTALVPGGHFGFKAGCGFVGQPCVNSQGHILRIPNNPKTFCAKEGTVCSPDGAHKINCRLSRKPVDTDVCPAYQYPLSSRSMIDDYCPVYRVIDHSECTSDPSRPGFAWEVFGQASRCLDGVRNGEIKASCIKVSCFQNGSEYSVEVKSRDGSLVLLRERCKTAGQKILFEDISFTCLDPVIMCTMRDYAHVGTLDKSNTIPGAVLNEDSRIEAQKISDRIYSPSSGPVRYNLGPKQPKKPDT
jgi:leishmanolysin-like peptidase